MFKAAKLGTKELGGLTFRIDRPKGYTKKWPGGRSWTYVVDYGYVPRIKGEDGEGLDAFVGDDVSGHLESFQKLRRDAKGRLVPDETKFLLGVTDREREAIYRFYGIEVNARRVYRDWDEVRAAIDAFKPKKHPVEKVATRSNPWSLVTHEGPIVGEDTDYESAKKHFKFALLSNVSDRETSPDTARVTNAPLPSTPAASTLKDPPSSKLVGPPPMPKRPTQVPVPSSSKPQVLKLSGDGFVAPLDLAVPDADNTFAEPHPNHDAEDAARHDILDRFFIDQIYSRRNVPSSGVSESVSGAILPSDVNG